MKPSDLLVLTQEVKLWIAITVIAACMIDLNNIFKCVFFGLLGAFAFPFPAWVDMAPIHYREGHPTRSLKIPSRGTPEAAGLDLFYAESDPVVIPARGRARLGSGFAFGIPFGYVGFVRERSSIALKKGLTVGAGVIDSDYTGEVDVLLFNNTNDDIIINPQEAIGQIVFTRCIYTEPILVDRANLRVTQRGAGGFGSTTK